MNRLAAALLFALLPAAAQAQTATLVRDINPHPPAAGLAGSAPRQFAAVGGRAVFVTSEGEYPLALSYLLWATDGSAAGTSTLVRLCSPCTSEPRRLLDLPGLALFSVPDAISGATTWRTDGTRAGTVPFRLDDGATPFGAFILGRRVLLEACDGASCRLWSTDGALREATLLSGPLGALAVGSDRAFFTTQEFQGGMLWVTDGTVAGTKPIRSIEYAADLTLSGSRAFFLTGGDEYPSDLWTSDGTAEGTLFLRSFAQPNQYQFAYTSFLQPVPGGILLAGISGGTLAINLWRSDGTRAGTRQLTSFTDLASLEGLRADQIAAAGGRVFFVATSVAGPRLWSTRGSAATTAPVTGCPGGCPALLPESSVVPAGDRVLFAARDLAHGAEPWTSDGTGAGTRILRDLCAGPCDSNPQGFTAHAGTIDFQATWKGQTRLVRTDGTAARPLAPLPPVTGDPGYPSPPIDLADVGSRSFFAGFDSQGSLPWVTDGTPQGSRRIVSGESSGGSDPKGFVVLGGQLLFTASDGAARSVWTVDSQGNAEPISGTSVSIDFPGPSELTVSGNAAYFVSDHGAEGVELWRTDGSPAGTIRLATFRNKVLSNLRDLGGRLVFRVTASNGEQPVFSFWGVDRGSDGTPEGTVQRFGLPPDTVGISSVTALGPELYFALRSETALRIFRSDGTAGGTREILQESDRCGGFGDEGRFVRLGSAVYFTACSDFTLFIYQTDGTAAGTLPVLAPPSDDSTDIIPQNLFAFQGDLYYFGFNPDQDSDVRWNLWRGRTAATAAPVKAAGFQVYDPISPEYTILGDRLYFRAWDPDHGFELWRTDGTAAGTVLVREAFPGLTSSDPQGLVAAGGRLWFSALDPGHGRELWTSDGTRKGTHPAADLAPGPRSSAPEQLTPFAGRLCFSADDGATGREPWCLPLE